MSSAKFAPTMVPAPSVPGRAVTPGSSSDDDVAEIEAIVKLVTANRAGQVTITLEDGARWQQVDTKILNREPKAGSKARIRLASMGSYLVSFDSGPAVRMKRIN